MKILLIFLSTLVLTCARVITITNTLQVSLSDNGIDGRLEPMNHHSYKSPTVIMETDKCDMQYCETECQARGFHTGVCESSRCICYYVGESLWRPSKTTPIAIPHQPGTDATSARTFSLKDLMEVYEEAQAVEKNHVHVATEALYIPTTLKDCNNSACQLVCTTLGFKHGTCVSSTTCHCYN
ncbi:uncharacterized protein LOC142974194 [Anticarsia gemmatalis]|uniref:uncharacterized protein LOC142974194 n=1 Tax=Anticarsia gemmatalis TaxID=129554 RepID=UPI003F76495C